MAARAWGLEVSLDGLGKNQLASLRSETARLSRAFSASISFRRFTWSFLQSPHSVRQRHTGNM